jgi:hypothetical protein
MRCRLKTKKSLRHAIPKTGNNPVAAKQALARLFPKLAQGWNVHIWDVVNLQQREQRRICTREYYRNYFLFGRDPDRLTRDEIEAVLSGQNPIHGLSELVRRLEQKASRRGASRVGALLDQVLELVFAKPLLSNAAIRAILDQSDALILREDVVWEFFVTDNLHRLDRILTFGLEPLSAAKRVERVRLMASYESGLSIAAIVIEQLAGKHGLYGQQKRREGDPLIPVDESKRVAEKILARLRNSARKGELLFTPIPISLLWVWARLSTKDEVKIWLEKQLRIETRVLRLAEVLPSTSYQSGGDGQKIIRSFKAGRYTELLDVEQFKSRLTKIAKKRDAPESVKKIAAEFFAAEQIESE